MKSLYYIAVLLGMLVVPAARLVAQDAMPPPAQEYQPLADAQLDQLLGPIALYPDPLIAEILPASTLPEQIVLADRYVSGGGDPGQIDAQPWDASVQALARYPTVLQWLDQNLDWTTELGQAFVNQQQEVMDSIQRLRQSAYNLGNLQSTPQEQVINDAGYIEIVPVDPQEIYLPEYQPDQVYYTAATAVPFVTFGVACAIGPWLACDFDWGNHNLIVWNHDHPRPANWWHEPRRDRHMVAATVWHPGNRVVGVARGRGDRGWGGQQHLPATADRRIPVPAARREVPVERRESPAVRPSAPVRPAPMPVIHAAEPVNHPEPNGAFIGVQSSHDTRSFSNRGQQSLQNVVHSAPVSHEPVSRPAPPVGGAGGGGGAAHGSGSPRR